MPLPEDHYLNMPATPMRQAYPVTSFGWGIAVIPSGDTVVIKEGPIGALPAGDDWLTGINSVVDIHGGITSGTNSASLVISAGNVFLGRYFVDSILLVPMPAVSMLSTIVSGYPLPAWHAQFRVYNPGPETVNINILIKVRSM